MRLASTTLVMLAALCWGLSGGIGGILMDDGWDPFVVSFYRGAIGLLCVLLWLALRPRGSGLSNPRLWGWSALAGLGVAGNFAFYFLSIAEGSVAVAATLMYCAPVFVYLTSFVLRLERPSPLKWAAIALVLLVCLFLLQSRGTAKVGALFAPVMIVYFVTIAGLGLNQIIQHPGILWALNPWYAVQFFLTDGAVAFFALGAVVLAVTGSEALYSDMGHFGRGPMRLSWFGFVMPCLLLNYFGQAP